MRVALLAGFLIASAAIAAPLPGQDASQRAHASGACGSLGPGTGLQAGKGWIVSMLPGKHEVRMRGTGTASLTVAKLAAMDFDVGRPYYIVVEGADANSTLEWKVPGSDWAAVPRTFLYPPQGVTYAAGQ
jgi:hypothetical protein